VAAGAVHCDGMIVGVNTGFHEGCLSSRPVCTASRLSQVLQPRR
jgi:hypothetical protein